VKFLIFAGAGTSVELGVPTMTGFATEFVNHVTQWHVEPKLVQQLMGDSTDIEKLIECFDQASAARTPLEILGEAPVALTRIDTARAELEWFVQHAAERIVPSDAELMWGSIVRATQGHFITFVTTNYDRAIELAAHAANVELDDGFQRFDHQEVAKWQGFGHEGLPRLVKLHGSTDWYANATTYAPVKLRHPMPLFGRATLSLSKGELLGSALVLPSREKLLNRDPYPRLSQAFLNGADECEVAIFVGSSMRDPHVRRAATEIAATRPVFIVGLGGNIADVPNAQPIPLAASQFLISTLPAALAADDPILALNKVSTEANKSSSENSGIFDAVRTAVSTVAATRARCDAIEELDKRSIALGEDIVSKLLSDIDPTVARFALGLVPTSTNPAKLLSVATASQHVTNALFQEELDILRGMV
jgi:hypothetical protein